MSNTVFHVLSISDKITNCCDKIGRSAVNEQVCLKIVELTIKLWKIFDLYRQKNWKYKYKRRLPNFKAETFNMILFLYIEFKLNIEIFDFANFSKLDYQIDFKFANYKGSEHDFIFCQSNLSWTLKRFSSHKCLRPYCKVLDFPVTSGRRKSSCGIGVITSEIILFSNIS